MAPRNEVLRQGQLNPLLRGMSDIGTQIRNRAHEGLEHFRAGAPSLASSVLQGHGDARKNAEGLQGLFDTAFSPVAGAGDVILGSAADPGAFKPGGDQGQRRRIGGDLASALVPVPGRQAADLTRAGVNGLLRGGRALRRTAEVADEVNATRRAMIGAGKPAETDAARVAREGAQPAHAPLMRSSTPDVRSTVTPHQDAAATWELSDDYAQRGNAGQAAATRAEATQKSQALGVPVSGSAQDMVRAHLQAPEAPATGANRRQVLGGAAAVGAGAVAAPLLAHLPQAATVAAEHAGGLRATVPLGSSLHEAAARAWAKVRDLQYAGKGPRSKILKAAQDEALTATHNALAHAGWATNDISYVLGHEGDPLDEDDVGDLLSMHLEEAASHRMAAGPYASSPLTGQEVEHGLEIYRRDPASAHDMMQDFHPGHSYPETEAGWMQFYADHPDHFGADAENFEPIHPLLAGPDQTDQEFTFDHSAVGNHSASFTQSSAFGPQTDPRLFVWEGTAPNGNTIYTQGPEGSTGPGSYTYPDGQGPKWRNTGKVFSPGDNLPSSR